MDQWESDQAAYDMACASAWRALIEACASAQRAYDEAIAAAERAYDEAVTRARALSRASKRRDVQ